MKMYLMTVAVLAACTLPIPAAQEQQKKQLQATGENREQTGALAQGAGRSGGDGQIMGEGVAQEAIIGRILNNTQLVSEVNLSETQVNTLRTALQDMRKESEELKKQLRDAGLEQARLMTGDTVDESALMAAVEKAGSIRTDMAKARIRMMLSVKKSLTPEQTEKIKDMVQKHMKQLPGAFSGGMKNQGEPWKEKHQKKHSPDESKNANRNQDGVGI